MNTLAEQFPENTVDWTDEQWNRFELWLRDCLHSNTVEIQFTKVDGTARTMNCTLDVAVAPRPESTARVTPRRQAPPGTIVVFDTDLNDWRSFRVRSLTNILALILKYR